MDKKIISPNIKPTKNSFILNESKKKPNNSKTLNTEVVIGGKYGF